MSGAVKKLRTERTNRYLENIFAAFIADPADTDFERGFLASALTLYRKGLGKGVADDRLALLDRQVSPVKPVSAR